MSVSILWMVGPASPSRTKSVELGSRYTTPRFGPGERRCRLHRTLSLARLRATKGTQGRQLIVTQFRQHPPGPHIIDATLARALSDDPQGS